MMAGLGALFTRSIEYSAVDTETGETGGPWTVVQELGGIAPMWPTATYRGALGLPGAWRAAVLISDLIGGLPWHALRQRAGRPVETLDSPLLEQPNPPDTRMATFSSLALDLLMHGNAVGVYAARNAQGYPTALVPVPADTVGVRREDRTGRVLYDVGGQTFDAEDVAHVKGPHRPGDLRGLGVLETHLDTLELADDLQDQARSVGNHGVPTGKLKVNNPEATKTDLEAVKAGWLKAQRERTVAVLNATTDFEPLSWNPTETQLLEARKFSLNELALIFGVDPSWLGAAQTSRVYSNIEQEAINLARYTLGGHLARFEQALTLAFPRGTWVKANLDSLLRADTQGRYQAHAQGIQARFLLPNEARALEDLPPIPGGDQFPNVAVPAPAEPDDDDQGDEPTDEGEES